MSQSRNRILESLRQSRRYQPRHKPERPANLQFTQSEAISQLANKLRSQQAEVYLTTQAAWTKQVLATCLDKNLQTLLCSTQNTAGQQLQAEQ